MDNDEQCLLINVANQIEAGMIEEMLKDADIPCIIKGHGSSGYMTTCFGGSLIGLNIYVPQEQLERAKELVAVGFLNPGGEIVDSEFAEQTDE